MQWVIGIDEAGRGPLAGPVAVGAAAIPVEHNEWEFWKGLKDSKKLSEKKRGEWYGRIQEEGIVHAVCMVGADVIDREGIVYAVKSGAKEAILQIGIAPEEACVLLDKNIQVGEEWQQEEFVKGDERIPVIALASIVAKVTRDRHMTAIAKEYPEYGFETHKGYGTKAHYAAIKEQGLCCEHRRTFLH